MPAEQSKVSLCELRRKPGWELGALCIFLTHQDLRTDSGSARMIWPKWKWENWKLKTAILLQEDKIHLTEWSTSLLEFKAETIVCFWIQFWKLSEWKVFFKTWGARKKNPLHNHILLGAVLISIKHFSLTTHPGQWLIIVAEGSHGLSPEDCWHISN